MILFVIDIFYLQFIRHFEINLTINLKKSRYITFIFLKQIVFCSNVTRRDLLITIFFYFSEQLNFHCAKDVFKDAVCTFGPGDSFRVK